MVKTKFGIAVNSTAIFILSFLSIKFVLFGAKYLTSTLFDIQVEAYNYTLWGVSSLHSGVWNYTSVLTFYGIECLLLLILILTLFLIFRRSKNTTTTTHKWQLLWYLNTSLVIFFALIIAGILTKQNIYHFFNWLYVPYSAMLIGVCILLAALLFLGRYFTDFTVRMNSLGIKAESSGFSKRYVQHFYAFLLPVIIGVMLLYLPNYKTIYKYDKIEIALIVLFFVSRLLKKNQLKELAGFNIPVKPNYPILISGILLYSFYLIYKLV